MNDDLADKVPPSRRNGRSSRRPVDIPCAGSGVTQSGRTRPLPQPDPWQTGSALRCVNPATLEQIGTVAVTTADQLDGMLTRAHHAFAGWRIDREARQRYLADCARELLQAVDTLAPLLTMEQGKPLRESEGEIRLAAQCLADAANIGWDDDALAHRYDGRTAVVEYRPVGVVAVLVPWDLPILRMAVKVGPALAAGNAVVVEPPPTVALSVTRTVELLGAVLPAGVLDVSVGTRRASSALVAHPKVRLVSYGGSRDGAQRIARQAAQHLTPATVTTASGAAALLLCDAPADDAAIALARSAFANSGQTLDAPKSAYVPADLVDDFCDAFVEAVRPLTVGDGMTAGITVGPLHSAGQLAVTEDRLRQSIASGGVLVTGGGRGTNLPGHFLEPTLLQDRDGSAIPETANSGPVFTVIGYHDLDQTLDRINEPSYVLSTSVWGSDLDRAAKVAERIDAEFVSVGRRETTGTAWPFEAYADRAVAEFLRRRVITH
ncbi:aldehyde dehydrogenase family protein [Rhodococcus tukisamuensis]|uniref:Acyl-CoA reductase n=1 Tax=Rhodococcus tukisamuensis TaxID=168276 RepID=A0A1G6STH6_9NOCA|nr:aldehyde dehydrogenase family protein [Rhodococcus tukisamuensis]SDD20240.1 Acyl-CoA reductase [Rhodococcus tukisamuensis]